MPENNAFGAQYDDPDNPDGTRKKPRVTKPIQTEKSLFNSNYLNQLTDTFANTAGGEGGALPTSSPPLPPKPETDTSLTATPETGGRTQDIPATNLSPVPEKTLKPADDDFSVPALNPEKKPEETATPVTPVTAAPAANPFGATISEPAKREAASASPAVPYPNDTVPAGKAQAGRPEPDVASYQAPANAGTGQETPPTGKQSDRFSSVPSGQTYQPVKASSTDVEDRTYQQEPAYLLAQAESRQYVRSWLKALVPLYGVVPDMAEDAARINRGDFDTDFFAGLSEDERRVVSNLTTAIINVRQDWRYDPAMAKGQLYRCLDRINPAYRTGTVGFDQMGEGSYSFQVALHQVRDYFQTGTAPTLAVTEQIAKGMDDLSNTPYGQRVRNFMASVHRGALNLTKNTVGTVLTIMASAPPVEIAMYHYQQMYLAHGNDTAGFALELEHMVHFSSDVKDNVGVWMQQAGDAYRSIRTDDYNRLKWLTLNPAEAAYLRPDKITGDFFEKLLPAVLGMKGISKAAQGAELLKKGELFVKGFYVVKTGYTNAYYAVKNKYLKRPDLIDSDPAYLQYRQRSSLPEQHARTLFVEARARESAVGAGMLSLMTFTAGTAFRNATTTGAESAMLQYFQQFVTTQAGFMTKEAFGGARAAHVYDKNSGNENPN